MSITQSSSSQLCFDFVGFSTCVDGSNKEAQLGAGPFSLSLRKSEVAFSYSNTIEARAGLTASILNIGAAVKVKSTDEFVYNTDTKSWRYVYSSSVEGSAGGSVYNLLGVSANQSRSVIYDSSKDKLTASTSSSPGNSSPAIGTPPVQDIQLKSLIDSSFRDICKALDDGRQLCAQDVAGLANALVGIRDVYGSGQSEGDPFSNAGQSQSRVLSMRDRNSGDTYLVFGDQEVGRIAALLGSTPDAIKSANQYLAGSYNAATGTTCVKSGQGVTVPGSSESNSLTFVSKYVSDSIRAMYGDDAFDSSGLGVVPTAIYNDYKRSQALSAFNLFGQSAIQQLAPLSLLSVDMRSSINAIHSSMTAMGFTDSMQLSALPSSGSISPLPYEIAAAYSESMAWQYPLSDINPASYDSRYVNQAIEDYNQNLITSMPADFESQMAAAVNSFWSGLTYDTGIGTVQVGGSTGGGNGAALGYNPPPTVGVSFSCPIGIDLGNGTSPLVS